MPSTLSRVSKVGLLVGYLALLVAVAVAHATPARTYELSIYGATPLLVWLCVGLAVSFGVTVAFAVERESRLHDAALLLVGSAVLSTVAMPILRGYFFYGSGDSLSHVGWAREISAGTLPASRLLYPGIHTATVMVGHVADVPLLASNLYVVLVAFPVVFALTVPLAVQLLARPTRAYAFGLFAALLFVPVNNIAVHFAAHPASQAILFSAFAFYLALAYLIRDPSPTDVRRSPSMWAFLLRPSHVTGLGALLAVTSAGLVLVHPQQALNLGLCLLAITGAQVVFRYWGRYDGPTYRPLHIQTAVIIGIFLVWAPRFPRVRNATFSTITSVLSTGVSAGDVVAQKSVSVTTIGGSLPFLFAKLFLVATIFSLLAGVLLAVAPFRLLSDEDANTLVTYLGISLVPIFTVFVLVLASASGDMYFRYQGFMMVLVTILGAVALSLAFAQIRSIGGRSVPALIVLLLLLLFPVGLAAVHPSPYMYQPNQQVTEAQASGYRSAFDHRQPGVQFTGIRGGPERFVDLYYGTERARNSLAFPGYKDEIAASTFASANYTTAYNQPRYLETTRRGYLREVVLYHGFRYSEAGFRALETTPGVNRVQTSEGFHLYYVTPGDYGATGGGDAGPASNAAPAGDATGGGVTDTTPSPPSTPTAEPTATATPTANGTTQTPAANGTSQIPTANETDQTATPSSPTATATQTGDETNLTATPDRTATTTTAPTNATPTARRGSLARLLAGGSAGA